MYDILLVSLPEMDKDKPSPALGFLKAYLNKHGYHIKTIDGNQLNNLSSIIKEIKKHSFKLLGISVFSYEQKDIALDLGSFFDNVVYGGAGVGTDWPEKDFIVGEGEEALIQYMEGNKYYPGINGTPPQQLSDISILPPPDYSDLFPNKNYTSAIISGSRGCVRNCSFCDVASLWPKYRFLGGATIANYMHEVAEKTGVKSIGFSDSLVNGSMKHFREMCAELAKKDKKIKWNGQFIVRAQNTFSEKDFDNLKNSGCSGLTIGIESGSEAVRYHMKKKFSNSDLDYFITNLGERNIKMKFLLIAGYPTETKHDFEQTISMIEKYKKYSHLTEISPHMMLIDKNTPLEEDVGHLYDYFGFYFTNKNSDYNERYRRFKKIFEIGKDNGYGFKKHALDKIEKFNVQPQS